MISIFIYIFSLCSLCVFSSVEGISIFGEPSKDCRKAFGNQLYIGPEIYHVERKREGGTTQTGMIYGVRAGYDHIRRYTFYLGFETLYGKGRLHGTSPAGNRLKSIFRDGYVEGRFGYTFQQKCGYRFAFTPYIGGGYAKECNNFIKPSPLTIHMEMKYKYFCGGFLSKMSWTPHFDMGMNFKVKYTFEPQNSVSNDSKFDESDMLVKEEFQYRGELPLTYHWCQEWQISLVPFYEFRHYGGHVNYPFDFFDTKLNIYGATLKLIYCL